METLSNDVTAYIVTNVISITDGQIYLDAKLFTGGQRPAVNIGSARPLPVAVQCVMFFLFLPEQVHISGVRGEPFNFSGLSVSRVGSSAQNKAMKKVGGALKMLMGEYRKMAGEQSLGGGAVSPVMIRGARCLQLFNQKGMSLNPSLSFVSTR